MPRKTISARGCGRRGGVGVDLRERHQGVAGIGPDDLQRVGHLAVVLDGELAAHRGDGQRRILAERPVDHVEVMDAEVGELAAGVVVEPAEAIEGAILVVRNLRRRPEPGFPVEALRRLSSVGLPMPLGNSF